MRTVVHLSDLHFGNAFDFLLEPLRQRVEALRPDLLVLSGDFAEHAAVAEFEQAREYISTLPKPQLVVPGNHDLPFYDPVRRYREGLRNYRRYIADDIEPLFRDNEMLVIGLSTPRVFPMKGGRLNMHQIAHVKQETCEIPSKLVKILVTHHPLDLPGGFHRRDLARHAQRAVETLSTCVDLLIAGHIHLSSTGATAARYKRTGHSMIFAQAGTAISKRNKGEPNSFNSIHVSADHIEIRRHTWDESAKEFQELASERFERCEDGWSKTAGPGAKGQVEL